MKKRITVQDSELGNSFYVSELLDRLRSLNLENDQVIIHIDAWGYVDGDITLEYDRLESDAEYEYRLEQERQYQQFLLAEEERKLKRQKLKKDKDYQTYLKLKDKYEN